MSTDNARAVRLDKLLHSVINDKQPLTRQNKNLFIEAICAAPDPATCIDKLVASQKGLTCLQTSMRFDLTLTFFNGSATSLIQYLSANPELAGINGGSFLHPVLLKIVEPPIFWTPFTKAFRAGQLQENAQFCFAWLLSRLILLPGDLARTHREVAQDPAILDLLLSSSHRDIRLIAQKIKHVLTTCSTGSPADLEFGPGGRHDNDFIDFRKITIMPTPDELISKEQSFLRQSAAIDTTEDRERLATHLDNQFRLLREDMLYELREELQVAVGMKKGNHRGFSIEGLTVRDFYYESPRGVKCKWGITLQCHSDMWQFKGMTPAARKAYVDENRHFFKHQSMSCLVIDGEIVAFPVINRDEELLAKKPPVIVVQLEGLKTTANALLKLRQGKNIKLLQINTALFAFEPILKALQEKKIFPLASELLFWTDNIHLEAPPSQPKHIVKAILEDPSQNLQSLLRTTRPISLDKTQIDSLLMGLTQKVSLIQGPPGTGKSFVGAILTKVLHDFASQKILVVCYTNHALDQFLEDLLDIGIPPTSIVRLGGKSTPRTAALALHGLSNASFKFGKSDHKEINSLKDQSNSLIRGLLPSFLRYKTFKPPFTEILKHLEFEHADYFEAFKLPQSDSGMKTIGKKGHVMGPDYLLSRWSGSQNAGPFKDVLHIRKASKIWSMSPDSRRVQITRWKEEMLKELVDNICTLGADYNHCEKRLNDKFGEKEVEILRSRRIIGCTTTAAAKYRESINKITPDVLLVEEAGEILESHILTALGAATQQLILIGDHKQLRPKVNNYQLTVERGEGYDLNRSLFERLVLKGYPHATLREQHRMRPEISTFVRHLTYPDLLDAPKTCNRPNLRGVRDNVIFINHEQLEDDVSQLEERRDMNAKSSKQNRFEVGMILKIVRYLAQQGYGTDKIVILTPYLGQLRELQEALKKENDPVLNDLDSYDLVRAGLISHSAAKIGKKPIRLATIDNYQGEESDIVIASLTRSNIANDIGFMAAPERLNVLLSRARDALIMIGNSHTFLNARKGCELWTRFFKFLKLNGHIYDGLPVICERHIDRVTLLKCTNDFDEKCPDGGCLEPCRSILNCSLHLCPSKCHQLSDHSKMPCKHAMYGNCPKGHRQRWACYKRQPTSCDTCNCEKMVAERTQREEFERQEKALLHAQKVAELDSQISQKRAGLQDAQITEERRHVIQQKEKDLEQANLLANQATSHPSHGPSNARESCNMQQGLSQNDNKKNPLRPPVSTAHEIWQHQKDLTSATNDAIDTIMEMTGLETVKNQVLSIKEKVDTAQRQNVSLKNERFNVSMLGNPGTGKTTVARHYGKFLASIQVIPSGVFIETTGSRLATDGVPGIKKELEKVLNAGGGIVFVDEAYQLTGQHNFQGSQVLDFLLAEMENHVGKVVFIFAGYNDEMEKFFQHNPGLKSRVPYTFQFNDYEDVELLSMLETLVEKKYNGRMKVDDEGGIRGLYGRIAVQRLGRGRGSKGFGNARALENTFAKICERQAQRLSRARMQGQLADDFLFVKEDLIGQDPSQVMAESVAWKKLQGMIGLGAVKNSVARLFSMVNRNYQRELLEKAPFQISLNRVFLGSPGTGKTTVAKYYGRILADLGLISDGGVVIKNPADFIGSFLGQSENQTKAILANTIGKVLIIDEAYMLHGGGSNGVTDPYKTAVIDTIVAEIQNVPGDDRCVLLLGYKKQMEEMFQDVNPGLTRRFALEDAFHFHDYTDSELLQALEWKLKDQDLGATDLAKTVAIETLSRTRNLPNFGNIGAVENLLSKAKSLYQTRQDLLPMEKRSCDGLFEPQDFDPEFNRGEHATSNLIKLFEDVVGCEDVIRKLEGWQHMAQNMRTRGMDVREGVPTNFVFKGPPGTGKTTTARKMGQVYYDMGFLSSTEVIECSASDLVGQYVGHTGPKTKKLFEKALGRVLFIDEAYRLSHGPFAKEAMDELVGVLTHEAFRAKLVVILAGYDSEMNELMATNAGLSSRFPEEIIFSNIPPPNCLEILKRKLKKCSIHIATLDDISSTAYAKMVNLFEELSYIPSWGNARDLETLFKRIVTVAFSTPTIVMDNGPCELLTVDPKDAITCLESMLSERQERSKNVPIHNPVHPSYMQQMLGEHQEYPSSTIQTMSATNRQVSPASLEIEENQQSISVNRDIGVTDEVWNRLQVDRQAADDDKRRSQETVRILEQELREAVKREEAFQAELVTIKAKNEEERAELMRAREVERLRELAAKAEFTAALEKEMMKKQEEARVQAKLRQMGVCIQGFQWIKQGSGYRCAGGSHFIENSALGI